MREYEPSAGEQSILDFTKGLYDKAYKFDKAFEKRRKENRKFFKGDQWKRRQPGYKSKSVTNFSSLIVRDTVALLTDNMPDMTIRPQDHKSDPAVADLLTKLIKHIFYKENMREKIHRVAEICEIEGNAYFMPVWDSFLNDGKGDIKIRILSPDSIKRDPSGENNFFVLEEEVTLSTIYKYFPQMADKVRSYVIKDKEITDSNTRKKPKLPIQSTDGSETVTWEGSQVDVVEQYQTIILKSYWIRDDTVVEVAKEETDKSDEKKDSKFLKTLKKVKDRMMGDEKQSVDVKMTMKYPYGRWIFIANDKIILEDKPCYTRHMPLVPIILEYDPESDVHGISVIDLIKQSQVTYNEMSALVHDWLRAVVYPKIVYDRESGFDPKKSKNKWGASIPKKVGTEVRFDSPPPLPNDIFRFMDEAKANIEYVSGIHDVTQGRRPMNVSAAAAIKLLQEASKTMIRPKARLLENALRQLAILIIDFIQYGYTTERIIRLNGSEEVVTINDMKAQEGAEKIVNDVSIGDYDVFVKPDSTLPQSRIERFDMNMQLAQVGFADRKGVLEESGLPNWKEMEERLAIKEQQMMAMQQEMAAQENQPPKQQPKK